MARIDSPRTQGGFSLPVVLIFLLVISLLATVGIRRATIGEAMSRNQIEYEVARQAAEAAMRDAERDLASVDATTVISAGQTRFCTRGTDRPLISNFAIFDNNCTRGQCYFDEAYYLAADYATATSANALPWWPEDSKGGKWQNDLANKPQAANSNCNFTGGVPLGTFTNTPRLPAVARQPEYMLEYFVRGTEKIIRITARGFGISANSEVVLQSYFRPFEITVSN